jgi:hypothetical protein
LRRRSVRNWARQHSMAMTPMSNVKIAPREINGIKVMSK